MLVWLAVVKIMCSNILVMKCESEPGSFTVAVST